MDASTVRAPLGSPEADHGRSPALLALIRAEALSEKTVLDVGCGRGWLSLALAPLARWVIGLDWDADAIARAATAARRGGVANVEFRVGDAETTDYGSLGRPIQMVVAHLCMSDAIVQRAAEALAPGSCLIFAALHTDQWKETGKVSRFAQSEEGIRRLLGQAGFDVEHLAVERRVREFPSRAAALEALASLRPKWEADGRWENYLAYLDAGGRQVTESRLLVKARRR
jgi:SAM-dependent methyltransferase